MNISSTLKSTFGRTKYIIAFCKNLSLKQVIGTNTPEKQLKNPHTNKNKSEKKRSLRNTAQSVCCKQIIRSETFKSSRMNEELQVNCNSNYTIYLPEYTICCKIWYVGKSKA